MREMRLLSTVVMGCGFKHGTACGRSYQTCNLRCEPRRIVLTVSLLHSQLPLVIQALQCQIFKGKRGKLVVPCNRRKPTDASTEAVCILEVPTERNRPSVAWMLTHLDSYFFCSIKDTYYKLMKYICLCLQ